MYVVCCAVLLKGAWGLDVLQPSDFVELSAFLILWINLGA